VESSPESLQPNEVSRGHLKKSGDNGYIEKSFNILMSFQDVLGKKVSEVPRRHSVGLIPALRKILDRVVEKRNRGSPKNPSSRPLAEKKATGMVPSVGQQTGWSPGTNRKKVFPKGVLELFQRTASQWSRDKCPQLGAALAYYTVFSLAPLVLLLLGIFGLIYGSQQAREKILEQLRYLMDPNAIKIVEDIANNAAQPKPGIIATAIGILIALFGASGIFGQLQDALNTIWSVKSKPGQGIWSFIRTRFLSFGMVAGVAFLLLVSLTLEGVLKALHSYLQAMLPGGHYIGLAIFYLFDLAIIVLLFAMIFRYLPDRRLRKSTTKSFLDAAIRGIIQAISRDHRPAAAILAGF